MGRRPRLGRNQASGRRPLEKDEVAARRLGEVLGRLRRKAGLTQEELCAQTENYYQDARSIRKIERGERKPDRRSLLVLLEALNADETMTNQALSIAGYAPFNRADQTLSKSEDAGAVAASDRRFRKAVELLRLRHDFPITCKVESATLADLDDIDAVSTAIFPENAASETWRKRVEIQFRTYYPGFALLKAKKGGHDMATVGYSIYWPIRQEAANRLLSQNLRYFEIKPPFILTPEEESHSPLLIYYVEAIASLGWVPAEAKIKMGWQLRKQLAKKRQGYKIMTIAISEAGSRLAEAFELIRRWQFLNEFGEPVSLWSA